MLLRENRNTGGDGTDQRNADAQLRTRVHGEGESRRRTGIEGAGSTGSLRPEPTSRVPA